MGSPTDANDSASDGESGGNGRTYDLAEWYRSCDPFAERDRKSHRDHMAKTLIFVRCDGL